MTGHTGFKGSWLSIMLHKLGARVHGFSLPLDESNYLGSKCSEIFETIRSSDIRNQDDLTQVVNRIEPDIIFHLAAQPLVIEGYKNPIETFETNIMGTLNLLQAARSCISVKVIICITTDKVYHNSAEQLPHQESDRLGGLDPYSASKACCELAAQSFYKSYYQGSGVAVSTARAGNVIGGGDRSENRLIPDILSALEHNQSLSIRSSTATRPWQHVIEPCWGYLKLAKDCFEDPIFYSQPFNFGPNPDSIITVDKLIEIFQIKSNKKIDLIYNPSEHMETKTLKLDVTKAKKLLEISSIWNIEESIQKILDWEQKHIRSMGALNACKYQIDEFLNDWSKIYE